MNQRRPRRENKKHLRFISELDCVVCGAAPVDPAHIKMADARVGKPQSSNIGMKADDRFVLPLCRDCHEEQHSMPERRFWQDRHTDAVLLALTLYSITGDHQEADRLIKINVAALRELA